MNWKPKILDVYITKKFLSTFFIAILLIIGIVIIFDISEKVDDFVQHKAPLKAIIFDYYVNFIPYFMNMFSPLFVFISVIFFTSRMAANSEIVAILSCGVNFHRMMMPYLFSATLIALLSLTLNLWVIPHSNVERLRFQNTYVSRRNDHTGRTRNIHYQVSPGRFVFVESFSRWNNTAYKFTLEEMENNRLVSKLSAETAAWDSTSGSWKLKKYFIRDYEKGVLRDRVRTGEQLDTVIALTVEDFYRNDESVEEMDIHELSRYIRTQRMRGDGDVKYSLIEMHNRFALPFSAFILTIMGVALSSKKKRGGIGWNLAVGIALSFSYILFLRFAQMFVYTGSMSPALALWLPNIIYAIIAAFLYKIAPK